MTDNNTTDININIDYYREIYNEWDFSPLNNSDLDDDLFEYLEESVSEIPKKNKVCIVFHIPASIHDRKRTKKHRRLQKLFPLLYKKIFK